MLITGAVLWLASAAVLDAYGRRAVSEGDWDAIVVAGCRVRPDGTPSLALQRRTAAAVELWKQGRAPVIVLTGGLGDHPPTEAAAAAAHAQSLGVPPEALIEEGRSTSTEENARFAAEVTQARRIIVVTDTYHIFRSQRVFGRHFEEVRGAGSPPKAWTRLKGALREVPAVVWYGLQGRL